MSEPRCVCPCLDALDCMQQRYGVDMKILFHEDLTEDRAAKRAEARGYVKAGHIGNQEARRYNQRTWCRYWSITPAGQGLLAELARSEVRP